MIPDTRWGELAARPQPGRRQPRQDFQSFTSKIRRLYLQISNGNKEPAPGPRPACRAVRVANGRPCEFAFHLANHKETAAFYHALTAGRGTRCGARIDADRRLGGIIIAAATAPPRRAPPARVRVDRHLFGMLDPDDAGRELEAWAGASTPAGATSTPQHDYHMTTPNGLLQISDDSKSGRMNCLHQRVAVMNRVRHFRRARVAVATAAARPRAPSRTVRDHPMPWWRHDYDVTSHRRRAPGVQCRRLASP